MPYLTKETKKLQGKGKIIPIVKPKEFRKPSPLPKIKK